MTGYRISLHPKMRTFRLGAVWCLGMLVGCSHHGDDDSDSGGQTQVQAVVGVQTATVTRSTFTDIVHAIGTVAPRPGHIAELSAPAPTRVTHVWVTVGQSVALDAPLVDFDRGPIEAQLHSAKVALDVAERAYARAQQLADSGGIPRKDVDQASADLAQAQAAEVTAERAQHYATLRAPIAGVVTRLDAELGGPADANQPIVEVADPSVLDLLLTVTPRDAERIHPGAKVEVATEGSAASQPAVVTDVAAAVDTSSGGVFVRARLVRPGRSWRIGETVEGNIIVGTHPNAVTVPADALVPDDESMKVFVVDTAHRAHATPVTIGARHDTIVEITKGLSGGETIVTTGAYGVDDSAIVRVAR